MRYEAETYVDRAIREAEPLDSALAPPTPAEIQEKRDERDSWLVVSARDKWGTSAQLAKIAGFHSMPQYRQALRRARQRGLW